MRRKFGQIPEIRTNTANPDKLTQIRTNERKNGQIPQIQTNQSFPCLDSRSLVRICANLSIFRSTSIMAEVLHWIRL